MEQAGKRAAWRAAQPLPGAAAILAGVLLGIAIGIYSNEEGRTARAESCLANARCIAYALHMYAQDHGGRLPKASGQEWVLQAYPYLRDPLAHPSFRNFNALYCPEDREASGGYRHAVHEIERETGKLDYASEAVFARMRKNGSRLTSYEMPKAVAGVRLEDIRSPAKTVILQETEPRHDGYAAVAYADRHVEKVRGR
ncbi:MAG TPA: hypothetical protein VMX94_11805 [Armatimonadota bacterium]|nr:hypothetical protein [Armatimonadota bacterium]